MDISSDYAFMSYCVPVYAFFLYVLSYLIVWIADLQCEFPCLTHLFPTNIDGICNSTATYPWNTNWVVNNEAPIILLAIHLTLTSLPTVRKQFHQYIPPSIEKSTVVLGASIILFWMFQVWIPEARILVPLNSPFVDFLVSCIYFYGWGYALYTASDVDLYELLGVKKPDHHANGNEHHVGAASNEGVSPSSTSEPAEAPKKFETSRHPIYFGFLIALWSIRPSLTVGRLVFNLLMTMFNFVAIHFDEYYIEQRLGEKEYKKYKEKVPFFPFCNREWWREQPKSKLIILDYDI